MNHGRIGIYAEVFHYLSVMLRAFIAFVDMVLKLKAINELFKRISRLIDENTSGQLTEDQHVLRKIIRWFIFLTITCTVCTMILLQYDDELDSSLQYTFDILYFPYREISHFMNLLGGFTTIVVFLTIQICYYSCCVQVTTLYDLLHENILELNDKNNNANKIIEKSVEFHIKIKETVKLFAKIYRIVIVTDFISYIIAFGMLLFNYNKTNTVATMRMVSVFPIAFFGALIFCHGSCLMSYREQQMALRLYTDLDWIAMDRKIQRSVLIMMAQFLKPMEIKLMGIKVIDMELIITVSFMK